MNLKPVIGIVLVVSIAVGLYSLKNRCKPEQESVVEEQITVVEQPAGKQLTADPQSTQDIIPISTQREFEEIVLKNKKPVALKVFSSTCPPCTKMAPEFKKVAQQLGDKIVFAEANYYEFENKNALNITSFPTVIVYSNGAVKSKLSGYHDAEQLHAALTELLEKH